MPESEPKVRLLSIREAATNLLLEKYGSITHEVFAGLSVALMDGIYQLGEDSEGMLYGRHPCESCDRRMICQGLVFQKGGTEWKRLMESPGESSNV
jgi:hypothetical protein